MRWPLDEQAVRTLASIAGLSLPDDRISQLADEREFLNVGAALRQSRRLSSLMRDRREVVPLLLSGLGCE